MKFYAVLLNNQIIGFIDSEEQKDFLLECDPTHEFLEFDWETGHNPPPMLENIKVENGKLEIVKDIRE